VITRRSVTKAILGAPLVASLPLCTIGRALAEQPKAPAPAAATRIADVPIFIYHHTKPGSTPQSLTGQAMMVTPETFERHLQYLQAHRYQTIRFTDLAAFLLDGSKVLPERSAIISFDDGWEDQFLYAFPLLQKYQFSATFFIVSGYVDHENFITSEQLRLLLAANMEIGSHTRSHPTLTSLSAQRQWDEIATSKAILEERLGVTIDSFAYPYGSYNAEVAALTQRAGYRAARTIRAGCNHTAADLPTLACEVFAGFVGRDSLALAAREARS